MIFSMTGFGNSVVDFNNKKISVEIKSLNSKQLDLNIRIPNIYREKEIDYRNTISKELSRGKIDMVIKFDNTSSSSNFALNTEVAKKYYESLKSLESILGIKSDADYMSILARMPEVINTVDVEVSEEEFDAVAGAINEAIMRLKQHRADEGKILEQDFIKRTNLITDYLSQIEPFEKERIETIKTRITNDLEKLKIDIDKNRYEQELIYYIEKLDITEEKVRLSNHCNYFLKTLKEGENQGKQLSFIVQEMGREINTIGSKANHSSIQQIVVMMKDELEKIREQLANIL